MMAMKVELGQELRVTVNQRAEERWVDDRDQMSRRFGFCILYIKVSDTVHISTSGLVVE